MLISEIRTEEGRLSARFDFESKELAPLIGFIEGAEIVADASSLLLAAWLPAWVGGENRIRIDGAVCPILLANLEVLGGVFQGWFRDMPSPRPVIECGLGSTLRPAGRRGAFLSAGVDSMSMLWERHKDIDVGVLIDYQGVSSVEESEARFKGRTAACRALCDDIGIDLWTVRTNLRLLNPNMSFWMKRYFGSFLAAVAHGLNLREVFVASSYDALHLEPHGSHPLVEPNCSSEGLTIKHYGIHQSRLDKIRVLADWPLALDMMNVCTSRNSGGKNCAARSAYVPDYKSRL